MTWVILIVWQLFALYGLFAVARDIRRWTAKANPPGRQRVVIVPNNTTAQYKEAERAAKQEAQSDLVDLQEDVISGLINFGMGKKQARQIVLENVQSLMPLDMAFNRCLRKGKAS